MMNRSGKITSREKNLQFVFKVPSHTNSEKPSIQYNPSSVNDSQIQSEITDKPAPQSSLSMALRPYLLKNENQHRQTRSSFSKPSLQVKLKEFNQSLRHALTQQNDKESASPIDAEIKRQIYGPVIPGASQNPAIPIRQTRHIQIRPLIFNFIPNRFQLKVMIYLFQNQQADQLDLYALAEPSDCLSYSQFDQQIDMLFNKGWISKQKISPENLFNFFGLPIEMSAKNKKNPVYRLKPNLSSRTLIVYLESQQQVLLELNSTSHSDSITQKIEYLSECLQAVIHMN